MAGVALCFALAAAWPSARNLLLAGATLAAVVWLGADALGDDRRGPRARLVMALALLLLAALPAFLLAADNRLWVGTFPGLSGGLVLWSVGIVSIAAGSRAAACVRLPAALAPASAGQGRLSAVAPSTQRGRLSLAIVAAIAFVSLCAFVVNVGGPIAYFKTLNNSAASTAGLTYVIWGISFAKYGSFAFLGEAWTQARRPPGRVIVAVTVAFLLLLFLGSRLLLLVALIQLLLLYAALRPASRRFWLALGISAVIGVVLFVTLGEFRRWESVPHHKSFATYLVKVSVPQLPRTYVNAYADAVRLSVLARRVVPSRAPYEYGKELLRILLQPIPGQLRPTIPTAPALKATFTSGHENGNALPVPVEGYIEFGFIGAVIFSALLGVLVGLVDRVGAAVRDVGWLMTGVAAGTGSVIVMRGSLHQGIALASVDVIGFLAVHRILYRRRAPAAFAATQSRVDTGPPRGVSVVIPTVDRPEALQRALAGVARAARKLDEPVEAIVANDSRVPPVPAPPVLSVIDGLPVRTVYTARAGGVRGPAAARNAGVAAARYDLIAFTDDDARCDVHWLAAAVSRLRADPNVAGIEGAVRVDFDTNVDPVRSRIVMNNRGGSYLTASLFARAEAVEAAGGFRRLRADGDAWAVPYREDTDFGLRLIKLAGPVPFVPEAFVLHPAEAIDVRRLIRLARFFVVDAAFVRLHPDAVEPLWRRPLARARIRLATAIALIAPLLAHRRARRTAAAAILLLATGVSVQFEYELRTAGIKRKPGDALADTLRRLPRALIWSLVAGGSRLQGEAMVKLGLVRLPSDPGASEPADRMPCG